MAMRKSAWVSVDKAKWQMDRNKLPAYGRIAHEADQGPFWSLPKNQERESGYKGT